MFWADTHFHGGEYLPDFLIYEKEAEAAGVGPLILCAGGKQETETARQAASCCHNIFYAAGLHPHDAEKEPEFADELEKIPMDSKRIAVGEIGLDYFYDFSPRESQIKIFEKQLVSALHLQLPAIIHCRDKAESVLAYEDAYTLLQDFAADGGRFVLHCYAGTPEFAEKFGALGSYFGIGGMITFAKADNIRELARLLPMDRMLTETDSPYLAPKPYRGQPNHSKYIPLIGAKLAEVRGISTDECAKVTTANAVRLFHLPVKESSHE